MPSSPEPAPEAHGARAPKALEKLDARRILATSERLERRISERFPDAGLVRVCGQLVELAGRATATTSWIKKPNTGLRALSFGVTGTFLLITVLGILASLRTDGDLRVRFGDLVQISEAAMNGIVLIGAAIWFFVSIETRFKRARVLKALHELRTLAHLIDVHQLTKDPELLGAGAQPTPSSPERTLEPWQLGRYLDYCTEMLSLTGKIAALYADGFDDATAIDAVTDLEDLTNALQQKIWQKIVLLETRSGARSALGGPT
jgi:hypothetical protein